MLGVEILDAIAHFQVNGAPGRTLYSLLPRRLLPNLSSIMQAQKTDTSSATLSIRYVCSTRHNWSELFVI